jgi:hypothetical protein
MERGEGRNGREIQEGRLKGIPRGWGVGDWGGDSKKRRG